MPNNWQNNKFNIIDKKIKKVHKVKQQDLEAEFRDELEKIKEINNIVNKREEFNEEDEIEEKNFVIVIDKDLKINGFTEDFGSGGNNDMENFIIKGNK